jgi:hypothetical protein
MTQIKRITDYLEEGNTLTCLDAFDKLGVTQLATRIFELKKQGYVINTERKYFINKYNERVSLVEYSMGTAQ